MSPAIPRSRDWWARWRGVVLVGLGLFVPVAAATTTAGERVLDLENGVPGAWISEWEEQGVWFGPARAPTKSKAKGSLTFFVRPGAEDRGILMAMADDPLPLAVRFPVPVRRVTVRLWAHTGSAARLQALDRDGEVVATAQVERVPQRTNPAEPMPRFELIVTAPGIASLRLDGPRAGEYLVADELRYVPE